MVVAMRAEASTPRAGSALLHPDPVPMDLSTLVPLPRRESHPVAVPRQDEPVDVRLHAPTPEVVIVRIIGPLHRRSVELRSQPHARTRPVDDLAGVIDHKEGEPDIAGREVGRSRDDAHFLTGSVPERVERSRHRPRAPGLGVTRAAACKEGAARDCHDPEAHAESLFAV